MWNRRSFVFACATLLFALALCNREPPVERAFRQFKDKFGTQWAAGRTADGRTITSLTGIPSGPVRPGKLADLAPEARALTGNRRIVFTELPVASRIGSVQRLTYPQVVGGEIVENAALILQHSDKGGPIDILLNMAEVPSGALPVSVRSPEYARRVVAAIVTQELARPPLALALWWADTDATRFHVETELLARKPHYLAFGRRLWRVYEVRGRIMAVVPGGPPEPVMIRDYAIDAWSRTDNPARAVVRVKSLMQFAAGTARVFDPSPANTLNLSEMPSSPQFALDSSPYVPRSLPGLDAPAQLGYSLSGTYVRIQEKVLPASVPEPVQASRDTPDFTVPRGSVEFAAANAYYHVDSMARWITTTLGIPQTVPLALAIDVQRGETTRKPQSGYTRDTEPYLWFSLTRHYKIHVAEDGDAIAHEYAHAILDHMTAGSFCVTQAQTGTVEAEAINEGFADYWALSTFSEQTLANKHKLDCFMEWANNTECLRRYPSLAYPECFNPNGLAHDNGQIWSGTLYEIFQALENRRELADGIILTGHLLRAPAQDAPTMKQMAEGIVIADGQRTLGSNRKKLCTTLENRFGPLTCCQNIECSLNWLF